MTSVPLSGRYERNAPAIPAEKQPLLAEKRVLVAGCGGLGGYILELLGRAGVGTLTAADGDVFSPSNLNRQLLSSMDNLGKSKAECAKERLLAVNPEVTVIPVNAFITEENVQELLLGQDLVIDALDNGKTRLILAKAAREAGIPLVSGGIAGWYGRVIVLFPEDPTADFLWEGDSGGSPMGNLAATAACVAALEAAEALKVLLGLGSPMRGKLLDMDLLSADWSEIPLG